MGSIFTKIINREIPGHIVAETTNCIAFFDISPLGLGHTLCVPKREIDYIFDLEEDEYTELMSFCKKVSEALEPELNCARLGVAVIGLEVPHAHVHLVPINQLSDLDFENERVVISTKTMIDLASRVKANFESNIN